MSIGRTMAIIALLLTASIQVGAATMAPMDAYTWKKRVLIVFTNPRGAGVDAQRAALAGREVELADRDMVVFAVLDTDEVRSIYGTAPAAEQTQILREKFDVPAKSGLTTILLGKDGGVKWREPRIAEPQELFDLIDTMPMRRQEM